MARSGSRLPRRVPEFSTLNSQAGETVKIFWLRDLSRKTLTSCTDAGGRAPTVGALGAASAPAHATPI